MVKLIFCYVALGCHSQFSKVGHTIQPVGLHSFAFMYNDWRAHTSYCIYKTQHSEVSQRQYCIKAYLVYENFLFVATPDSESGGEDSEEDDTDQDLRDQFDNIYPDEELASPLPSPTSPDLENHMGSSDDSPVQLQRSRWVAAKIETSSLSSAESRPVSTWASSKDIRHSVSRISNCNQHKVWGHPTPPQKKVRPGDFPWTF